MMNKKVQGMRHRFARAVAGLLLAIIVFTTVMPMVAYASESGGYKSWLRTNSRSDAGPGIESEVAEDAENDNDPDPLEKLLAKMVASLATGIRKATKTVDEEGSGDPKDSGYDFSVTGIVMGKVTNGVSYFVFDLTDDNIYGRIGASIYVLLRAFCFAVLFLSTIYRIIKSIYITDGKGLSHLKDAILTTVIVMILMFIMPQIVDFLCEVRDKLSVIMYEGMTGLMGGSVDNGKEELSKLINMEQEYYEEFVRIPNLLNALVYLMMCLVPFIFIVSYLRIAITQTVLFGLFPIFAVLSPGDKQSLNGWTAVVFSNIFIPTIDITLLLLPMLLLNALRISMGGDIGGAILQAIVTVVMMISIVPVRNQLLAMLGNKFGMKGGLGLLGAGLLAAGAIQGAAALAANKMKGGGNKSEDGEGGGSKDDGKADDEALRDSTKAHVQDMGEVPAADAAGGGVSGGDAANAESAGADDRHEEAVNNAINEAHETADTDNVTNEGDFHAESMSVDGEGMGAIPSEGDHEVAVAEATAESGGGDSALSDPATGTAGESAAGEARVSGGSGEGDYQAGTSGGSDSGAGYASPDALPPIDDGSAAVAAAVVTTGAMAESGSGLAAAVENRAEPINNPGSSVDKAGRDFNMARAANLQSIDNMENKSREITKDTLSQKAVMSNAQMQMANNNAKIQSKQQDLKHMDAGSADAQKLQGEINGLQAKNASHQQAINNAQRAITQNGINQQALKAEIGHRRGVEQSMAQSSAAAGRGGQVYRSAGDFQRKLEQETRERKFTSFRDAIDSKSTAFSQSERSEFHRTKARHDAGMNALKVAGTAAAVTAGLAATGVATLAVAAGGEEAMSAVANRGINMSTDPNMHALPGAMLKGVKSVDNALGNRPSTYARAGGRAVGAVGHAAGGAVWNSKPVTGARSAVTNSEAYKSAAYAAGEIKGFGRYIDDHIMDYGKKK